MNNIKLVGVIFLILIVAVSNICILQNIKVKKLLTKTHYKFLKHNKKI
jgi:hypothetical protein